MSAAERQARYRQTDTGRAKERARDRSEKRRAAARERRRRARAQATAARPFIALDGEGITGPDGVHRLVILAASTGAQIVNPAGIGTVEALTWLMQLRADNPDGIYVGFGFGYDANMILRDLPVDKVDELHAHGHVHAGRWFIHYVPNRQLTVRDDITGTSVTVWDVRGYWRSSFVKAVRQVVGHVPAIIEDGKAARARFSVDDLDFMADYNRAELVALVELMQTVRARLHSVGIRVTRYDGAGSIASVLMRDRLDRDVLAPLPEKIQGYARGAFYGGRIECLKYGHTDDPVYVYDLNSAYPHALTHLPDWRGTWRPELYPTTVHPHSLYLIRWQRAGSHHHMQPLPYRGRSGGLCFPVSGLSWVWSPEAQMLEDLGIDHEILEGRVFVPENPDARPFTWVQDVYEQRMTLARQGDQAADLLKLGLAAIWGKLAQQTGWTPEPLKIPRYHHIASAGYVTSHVRAELMRAAWPARESVVAVETDSLITLQPLDLPLGDGLGQWSMKRYEDLTYLGSGLSWAQDDTGMEWARTAGVPRGRITRAEVLAAAHAGEPDLTLGMPQFVGMGLASILPHGWSRWLTWEDATYKMPLRPEGKRVPWAIPGGPAVEWSRLNPTLCPVMPNEIGLEYVIEWENPDPVFLDKKARMIEHETATAEALNYD